MKLIIQIPCFNESQNLAQTLRDLPRKIPGVDQVEVLVIDDGSNDGTAELARRCGVEHVLRFEKNQGLAKVFSTGLEYALRHGADVIVNTDGDNQYRGDGVPGLIQPILEKRAEITIGARPIKHIKHFSIIKKKLQWLGSWLVSALAGVHVKDAASGFRAFSRDAALRIIILSRFSYTLETILLASALGISIEMVPIHTNPPTRPSRLFRSMPQYLWKSAKTVLQIFSIYKPIPFFSILGLLVFLPGVLLGIRFLYFLLIQGHGTGHIQSLILAAVFLLAGVQVTIVGILSHLVWANRRINEEILYRIKKMELSNPSKKLDA